MLLCFTWSLLRTSLGKNPVCANALTQSEEARLSSRPLWDAAHCLCVCCCPVETPTLAARVHFISKWVTRLRYLPLSARRPPQLKNTNGGSIFVLELPPRDVEKDAHQQFVSIGAIFEHMQSNPTFIAFWHLKASSLTQCQVLVQIKKEETSNLHGVVCARVPFSLILNCWVPFLPSRSRF